MFRSSPPSFGPQTSQPFLLIPREAKKQGLYDPKRTRLGIGHVSIDHAAGMPVRSRGSIPPAPIPRRIPFPANAAPTSPRPVLATAPAYPEPRAHSSVPYRHLDANDVPVDLPMRSRSAPILVGAALLLGLVAICVSVLFTGINPMMLITKSAPAGNTGNTPATHLAVSTATP